ncbi:MAG: cyclic nucleotide-binding domain-containing protein [Alphaproteobacteria bacterium]|nr:cyclic nucleotide-binding domain-containing protein [Alphaproteobacteria bacterium]
MTQSASGMGEQVTFKRGDTIYAQGDDSTGVYMILEGQIDIWRIEGDNSHHIAALASGELLGEVSVIEKKKHSVTAKASQDTTALFITAEAFRKSFADPLVRHVVHTLATRLRSSYAVKEAIEAQSDQPASYKSDHPFIEGLSRMVADKMLTFVEVKEFPFIVGNIATESGHAEVWPNRLRVPLRGAPELADNHFEIIRRDGGICVRDLGSSHGTVVNGEKLSKYALKATAKLKVGKNKVSAGGPESPVQLQITVPPAAVEG